jgi:hypothetical protein
MNNDVLLLPSACFDPIFVLSSVGANVLPINYINRILYYAS